VKSFNTLRTQIDTYTKYDATTGERGLLLGDGTVQRIGRALNDLVVNPQSGLSGTLTMLKQMGVSFTMTGKLKFDSDVFYARLGENLESVTSFFTSDDIGFADRLADLIDELADPHESVLTAKHDALDRRLDLLNDRIEHMNVILGQREARLIAQFTAMETALAGLQAQQTAIENIRTIFWRPRSKDD
jgi:flagellar hook-associated protein 2